MPEATPKSTIPSTPPGQPLDPKAFDRAKEAAQAEADAKAGLSAPAAGASTHRSEESPQEKQRRVDLAAGKKQEEESSVPRAIRAIGPNGNVLRAESWLWKRDPSEQEREAFLRSAPGAATVDIVPAL